MGTAAGLPRAMARAARRSRSLTAGMPATIERSYLGSTYSSRPSPSVSMTSFLIRRTRSRVRRLAVGVGAVEELAELHARHAGGQLGQALGGGSSDIFAYHSGARTASR